VSRCALLAVLVALVPCGASAANGLRPRTLPTFEREQCLTVIDVASPTLHVDFSIPFEDATRGPDELDDSRTFQFFALCRDHHAELEPLPNWIAQGDLDRSLASEIITELPPDDDVLDLASTWADCAWRLVPDDARVPITCDATQGGIDFDASMLPVGNYVVRGYTFEPSINVWVPRRGVVQVRGDEPLPVVSLMSPPRDDWQAYEADGFDVVGCMDGPPGTSVRVEWASLIALEWTELATLDAAEQTFSIHFDFPPEAVGQPVIVRAIAAAGSGEAWTAFAPGTLIVLPGDGEGYGPEPPPGVDHCGFFPDAPDATTGGSSGDGSTSGLEPDTDTEAQAAADRGGCGCRAADEGATSELALAFVLALGARGRCRRRAARRVGGRSPAVCARVAAV
jgi:hypothetical protein